MLDRTTDQRSARRDPVTVVILWLLALFLAVLTGMGILVCIH
jgi:hypothetical protein